MLFAKEHKRLGSYMWEDAEAVSVQEDLLSSILMTCCKVRRKINGFLDILDTRKVSYFGVHSGNTSSSIF